MWLDVLAAHLRSRRIHRELQRATFAGEFPERGLACHPKLEASAVEGPPSLA